MEFFRIHRELFIHASPEIVFEVVSDPVHLQEWWADDARFEPTPGSTGDLTFGDSDAGGTIVAFTVVSVDRPRTFSFRWSHPLYELADENNSLLVTFELVPLGEGTLLKFTESGFRERYPEPATRKDQYEDHVRGWSLFLPRLAPYIEGLKLCL